MVAGETFCIFSPTLIPFSVSLKREREERKRSWCLNEPVGRESERGEFTKQNGMNKTRSAGQLTTTNGLDFVCLSFLLLSQRLPNDAIIHVDTAESFFFFCFQLENYFLTRLLACT